jgi:hypothetical protein
MLTITYDKFLINNSEFNEFLIVNNKLIINLINLSCVKG